MFIIAQKRCKAILSRPILDPHFLNLTPLQFFTAQQGYGKLCWLDSADQGWSYFARDPVAQCSLESYTVETRNMLRCLNLPHTRSAESDGPPFCGGWIGFLTYDNRTALPAVKLNFFDAVLAYQHVEKRWWVGTVLLDETSPEKIASSLTYKVSKFLEHFAPDVSAYAAKIAERKFIANFSKTTYCDAVRRALNYISAGDVYQLNLAQRFTVPWETGEKASAQLFMRLREQSPAAFGVFMGHELVGNDQAVCSISPELFLRVRDRTVTTRPIKGTRARPVDAAATAAAARELDANPKERAELNMIIDVLRHDLGRVCEFGSVSVESAGTIEELPTLLHRVATISGRLRARCSAPRLLRAVFPGGSVTGAPKIRAMQIIDELEPDPRGLYCGAIGWLGVNGDLDLNIAIRTAIHDTQKGTVQYHAGSGIVADSDPESEYDETLQKARAFFRATQATPADPGAAMMP